MFKKSFKKNKNNLSSLSENILKPNLKKIKLSNSIVVGGMIAFGKSTLATELHKAIKESRIVYELNDDDQLLNLLLEKMYSRENNLLYGSVFQLFFLLNRFDNYKTNCNKKELTIFDRSIFEDWLFAHENIVRPSVFSYYDSLWKDVAYELIYQQGVPKLYIILSGDWELFKQRLFERDRKVEIENFNKNKTYFKKLLEIYEEYMINVCKDFGIEYIVVDAKKPLQEKIDIVIEKIKTISDLQKKLVKENINKVESFFEKNNLYNKSFFSLPNFIIKFYSFLEKNFSENELDIFYMINALGPYNFQKNYEEISFEKNITINKVKSINKNLLKKIKNFY